MSMMRQRILKTAVGAFIVALLFLHPFTRPIIRFLLPLGSGMDDLFGTIGLVIGGVFLFSWIWTGVPLWKRGKKG